MTRITCKTPSTGRAIVVSMTNVTTAFTTIAEAPDFSVPDPSQTYTARDPLDDGRAIRPGEVFFVTPLTAKNKSAGLAWIEIRYMSESNTAIEFGKVTVPPGDTAFIPIQGRSIFKRIPAGINGDRIQIRAETSNVFDVWAAAEEKLSAEHFGIIV